VFSSYNDTPKEAKYLIYASVMPAVAYGLLFTDISYFLTAVQGISADFTGVIISAMGISAFVASIFLGIAADDSWQRIGKPYTHCFRVDN
jgi:predicted MFS family arabinose efflux permease